MTEQEPKNERLAPGWQATEKVFPDGYALPILVRTIRDEGRLLENAINHLAMIFILPDDHDPTSVTITEQSRYGSRSTLLLSFRDTTGTHAYPFSKQWGGTTEYIIAHIHAATREEGHELTWKIHQNTK